ncbi:MAG: response regulator [Candidatus Geothermincolia bacterium]
MPAGGPERGGGRTDQRIKVFIIDDHEIVRTGLRLMLKTAPDMELVGEAACGEDALRLVSEQSPDVLLVDVRLPDISGIEVVRRLKGMSGADGPEALMLTVYDDPDLAVEAMRAGALGFLLKDCGRHQLLTAIRSSYAKEATLAPELDRATGSAAVGEVLDLCGALTNRERNVLQLLAEGLSNRDIAGELFISEGTVKVHLKNLYRKLQVDDRTQAVMLALRAGVINL